MNSKVDTDVLMQCLTSSQKKQLEAQNGAEEWIRKFMLKVEEIEKFFVDTADKLIVKFIKSQELYHSF
jgi:hypothetical protein